MLAATNIMASQPADQFDPVKFEQRFHKADKGNKGKLSREEAYAEFPRMPEFFDKIDSNKDDFITLEEVHKAVERLVDEAMAASHITTRYGGVDATQSAAPDAQAAGDPGSQFSSNAEARRYYRMQYYESMADNAAKARELGEPVTRSPSTPYIKVPF